MSKKAPKKVPVWIGTFATFAKGQERGSEAQHALDTFPPLLTKHWPAFLEKQATDLAERPTKKTKTVDPIKNLGKAMDKVAEYVASAKDNQALLSEYKKRMREIVPDEIRPVLADVLRH